MPSCLRLSWSRGSSHRSRKRTMAKKNLAFSLFIVLCLVSPATYALKGLLLSPSAKRLADNAIARLLEISKTPGGTKQIGKELGKLQLPDDVLEDTFLRIAFAKQIIKREEAIGLFSRLSGVQGFRSTLSKIIGANRQVTQGHLNELRIAAKAHDEGFAVRDIGRSFRGGTKQWTDIDVVLEKNGKTILVEAKDYAADTPLNMIAIRRDLDTLNEYRAHIGDTPAIKIFSLTNIPTSPSNLTVLVREAKKRNIELVFGQPTAQAMQFRQLEAIL